VPALLGRERVPGAQAAGGRGPREAVARGLGWPPGVQCVLEAVCRGLGLGAPSEQGVIGQGRAAGPGAVARKPLLGPYFWHESVYPSRRKPVGAPECVGLSGLHYEEARRAPEFAERRSVG
jgi:hypothetical protein